MAEKKLTNYIKPHARGIALAGVVIAITVAVNLALPLLVRLAIDGLTAGDITHLQLLKYMGWYAVGVSILALFSFWTRWLPMRISHKLEYSVRRDIFKHLTGMDQAFFRTERTGDLMTRMSSDLTTLRNAVAQGLLQGMRSSMVFVGAFAVMFFTDWKLSLVMLGLFPILVIIFYTLLKRVRSAHDQVQEQYAEVSNFSQESFSGIRNIKGAALEDRWLSSFKILNSKLMRRFMRLTFRRQPLWPLAAFWFSLGMISILILGGRQVVRGELTLGTLVQFIQYLLYMQWPMLALSWTTSLMQRGSASWARVNRIFCQKASVGESDSTNWELTRISGDVVFEDVSFAIGGKELLRNIDLRIPQGSTVGITGPCGSGKTLLVSLLTRLADPTAGRISIGRHEIREYPLKILRSQIGFASQESMLFSRPLGENIAFGLKDFEEQDISWAAHISHLDMDVEAFPERYDTILGERGITLSGGQRQRTSLSRAIAREPAILILDDVLSAVDAQTEARIMSRLLSVMAERTSFLTSHRISTLSYADFIVVIENGQITQRGTHRELLAEDGYYAELNAIQRIEEELKQ